MSELELEGEVLAEEDAEPAEQPQQVRVLERAGADGLPVLRGEVRTAAIAAAGGVLAGAATVAAVRAVSAVSSRGRGQKRLARRRERPAKVVASRSFLVDVHLLGR
jgi:hypothetical protein